MGFIRTRPHSPDVERTQLAKLAGAGTTAVGLVQVAWGVAGGEFGYVAVGAVLAVFRVVLAVRGAACAWFEGDAVEQ